MKKSKKIILWIVLFLLFLGSSFFVIFRIINDPSRLTPIENEWINSNLNKVLSVSVVNDTNVFGTEGVGVFYDFVKDFSTEYSLKVNAITYKTHENVNGIRFGLTNVLANNQIGFYEDHYVLVSKKRELITEAKNLATRKIGILASNLSYLQNMLDVNLSLVPYNSKEELLKALESTTDIQSILVPRLEYMDAILSKDYRINYHFSSISRYYTLTLDEEKDKTFSSVLKKYAEKWQKQELKNSYYKNEFDLFVQNLGISQTEVDKLQSVTYRYGFVNHGPYEILAGGNFGGIVASYLDEFSKFSGVEFNFKRYHNYKKLVSNINDGNVDLYFEYHNFTSEGTDISSDMLLSYDVVVPESSPLVVSSLKSLKNRIVYVEDNTLLASKLKSSNSLQVKTYEGEKGLKKAIKDKEIIILDHEKWLHYSSRFLKDYSSRYTGFADSTYSFRTTANATFQKLFTFYLNYLDQNEFYYKGMYHYAVTAKKGTIVGTLAKYFLIILTIFVLVFFLGYRLSKRVHLKKKIKKEDKIKFIDQLTSLKNRNYLNDNIDIWNKNNIYPQTVVVIDLNRLQEINDTAGYEQGDEQIKAAANVLIKTQLDNSDIIRTDGNEFLIYLIGYQTKQITSYIYKLNREFKHLPYDYGAGIGYSVIENDLKSIEDAINEAVEDVKKQKEMNKEDM